MKKLRKVKNSVDKNVTWNNNHTLIMEAFDKLYDIDNKFPTMKSLAEETGLSVDTIYKHADSLTLENVNTKYKIAGEKVSKRLIKRIEDTGDPAAVKLYNQIVFGYREENKTIHEFSEAEAKEKIENLFLK